MSYLFSYSVYAKSNSTRECQINQIFIDNHHFDQNLFHAVDTARKMQTQASPICTLMSLQSIVHLNSVLDVSTTQVDQNNGYYALNINYKSKGSDSFRVWRVVLFGSLAFAFHVSGNNEYTIDAIFEFDDKGEPNAYLDLNPNVQIIANMQQLIRLDSTHSQSPFDYQRFIGLLPQYDWKGILASEIMWTVRPLRSFFLIDPLKKIYGKSFVDPPVLPSNFVAVIDDSEFNLNEPMVARKFKFRSDSDIESTLIEIGRIDGSNPQYFTKTINTLVKGFQLFEDRAPEILELMKHQSRWNQFNPWEKHGELVTSVLVQGGIPDYSIVPLPGAFSSEPIKNLDWSDDLKKINEKYQGRIAVVNMSFGSSIKENQAIISNSIRATLLENPSILHIQSAMNEAANTCVDSNLQTLYDLPNYLVVGSVNQTLGITFVNNGQGSNYGCVHVATQAYDIRQFTTAILGGFFLEFVGKMWIS